MADINKILVASDGSEHAIHAASFAGELARTSQASVEVVTVHSTEILNVQLLGVGAWPGGVPASSVSVDEIRENVEAAAKTEVFEPAIKALGDLPSEPECYQQWGHPGEIICERANDIKADLIVIGSRGRSIFTKLMLGSVTIQVLNHADCPVTVVR